MGITHRIVLMLALAGVLAACGQDTDNTTKQDTSDSRDTAPARADAGDGEPLVTGLPDFTALVKKEAPAVVNISTVTRRERSQQSQLDQLPEMFRRFFDEFGGQVDGLGCRHLGELGEHRHPSGTVRDVLAVRTLAVRGWALRHVARRQAGVHVHRAVGRQGLVHHVAGDLLPV